MEVEEVLLVGVEVADVGGRISAHAHFDQGAVISDRGDDELAIVGEGNESTVEEVVDRGGEQEAVAGRAS